MDFRFVDLKFNKNRPDRPVDTVQLKEDINFCMSHLLELREKRFQIENLLDELKAIQGEDRNPKVLENLTKIIDSTNERLEALEAIVTRQSRLESEYSSRGRGKYLNMDYLSSFDITDFNNNYVHLDTKRLAETIENFLDSNRIPRKFFLTKIFNGEAYTTKLTSLLTEPTAWAACDANAKDKYVKLRLFLKDFMQKEKMWNSYYCHENNIEAVPVTPAAPAAVVEVIDLVERPESGKNVLEEFKLPIDFKRLTMRFVTKNKISVSLFSQVVTGSSRRQLARLLEKVEALASVNAKLSSLSDLDISRMHDLSLWFNSSNRLALFEKLKQHFIQNNPNHRFRAVLPAAKYEDDNEDSQKKRVGRPKIKKTHKGSLTGNIDGSKSNISLKQFKNLNNKALLNCFYRANTYPNEDELGGIADLTGNSVDEVQAYYSAKTANFPLYAITAAQYRQIYDYFYKVKKTPSIQEMHEFAESRNVNEAYLSRWFSRQRKVDTELKMLLAQHNQDSTLSPATTTTTTKTASDYTAYQEAELEKAFRVSMHPDEDTVQTLKDQLGLSMEAVFKWFKAKRENRDEAMSSTTESSETSDVFEIDYEYE